MSPEKCKKIYSDFPDLFQVDPTLKNNLLAFGCECGDGWFHLIYGLCEAIQQHIDDFGGHSPKVLQIKEKYGTLRFYIDAGDSIIWNMIELTENLSGQVCEVCGGTSGTHTTWEGWAYTRCDKCRK